MKTKCYKLLFFILLFLALCSTVYADWFIFSWTEPNLQETSGFRVYVSDEYGHNWPSVYVSADKREFKQDLDYKKWHYIKIYPISKETGAEGAAVFDMKIYLRQLNENTIKF